MPEDGVSVTVTGEAFATVRHLAATRGVSVAKVLETALSHELWMVQNARCGHRVYVDGCQYREELLLPETAVPAAPGSRALSGRRRRRDRR